MCVCVWQSHNDRSQQWNTKQWSSADVSKKSGEAWSQCCGTQVKKMEFSGVTNFDGESEGHRMRTRAPECEVIDKGFAHVDQEAREQGWAMPMRFLCNRAAMVHAAVDDNWMVKTVAVGMKHWSN